MTPPCPQPQPQPRPRPWLARFAAFTALATLGLIGMGGLVTSHGAGMAVPDWPTTYGYNMFLFPISQWVGGIFYEHTHRLWASGVGLFTLVLAVWMHLGGLNRRLVRWGWVAVALVCGQGLLGGLRVSLMRDQLGIFHASLAQAFLVLVSLLAVFLSRWWADWRSAQATATVPAHAVPTRWVTWAAGLIFLQLMVGATMRHQHAGLAIPDFPLAYGRIWPPSDDAFLQSVNALRSDARDFGLITAFQIQLHMLHRGLAVLILVVVVAAGRRLIRAFGTKSLPGRLGWAWIGTVFAQATLGACTVWFNKAADLATAHVVFGAVCLVFGAVAVAFSRAVMRPQVAAGPWVAPRPGELRHGAGDRNPTAGPS